MRSAALTEMGQYEQARAILAAANHSADVAGDAAMQSEVQLGLWIICAWQQKFAECTLLAESLVALTPRDALPHRLAALSYSAKGFEERAMQSAEVALGLRGDKRSAWGTLGRVYYQKGDVENSLRCFVRCMDPATSASPAYQEDALWFAFVLATCPDDRFRNSDLALTVLEKVKEKWRGAAQDAQFLVLQAICLASSGRTVEAAGLVRRAIETPPRPGEAREHFELLETLFVEGKAYHHDPKSPADQLIRITAVSVIGCSKRLIGATANSKSTRFQSDGSNGK
jgi:tetratricopeptide (TPR) repeat protein